MNQETVPLFRYVRQDQYRCPPESVREMARSGLRALWREFRRPRPANPPVSLHAELRSVPQDLLDLMAPAPDLSEAVPALNAVLEDWLKEPKPRGSGQMILGPPGSGTTRNLTRWGRERNAFVLEPPSARQILEGGEAWLAPLNRLGQTLLVLPSLERCYLRHQNGLNLLRRLLEWRVNSSVPLVAGCNSWAWAYLKEALRIDLFFPQPWILEPLDGSRLLCWFRGLAGRTGKCLFSFRLADDGSQVLPADPDFPGCPLPGQEKAPPQIPASGLRPHDFLIQLAGRYRGIPLVAWAVWRHSLNIEIDKKIEAEALQAAVGDTGETAWVQPGSQVHLPEIPQGEGRGELFLLHALLLHDGLPADLLPHLLPLPQGEIVEKLHRLTSAGLVKEEAGLFRVSLLGYPAARDFLKNEDYLTDPL